MILRGFTDKMVLKIAEQEKTILEIVHDYLDKNRQFTFEEIIPYIIYRVRLASLNFQDGGAIVMMAS